jgi:hypothetical protein
MDFNFANYLRKYGQDIPNDLIFKAAMKEKKIKPKSKDSSSNKDCHRCKMVGSYKIIQNYLLVELKNIY